MGQAVILSDDQANAFDTVSDALERVGIHLKDETTLPPGRGDGSLVSRYRHHHVHWVGCLWATRAGARLTKALHSAR